MIDKLSLVSWTPFRREIDVSRTHWWHLERSGYQDKAWVEVLPVGKRGKITTYRVEFNPNRVFNRRYTWSDLRGLIDVFWPFPREKRLSGYQAAQLEREMSDAGLVGDPRIGCRVRVSRIDLNADLRGDVHDLLSVTHRQRSRRFALYVENGRLNGFYVGKNPLVRIYQKLRDEGVVRVEWQNRPRLAFATELEEVFKEGFSLVDTAKLSFATTSYCGKNRVLQRAYAIVRDAEGDQAARLLLGKEGRKRLVAVDVGGLRSEVDAGYWDGWRSWDEVTEEAAVQESVRALQGEVSAVAPQRATARTARRQRS